MSPEFLFIFAKIITISKKRNGPAPHYAYVRQPLLFLTVMFKDYLLIAFATLTFLPATAEIVSRTEALKTAEEFLGSRGLEVSSTEVRKAHGIQSAVEPYYVFNTTSDRGFVIIAGDDQVPAILGYTDSGSFDEENLPVNFRDWLESCALHIETLRKYPTTEKSTWGDSSRESIAPLLTSSWNQDAPYNDRCPSFFTVDAHCVTGCAATALAQVMYYHRAQGPDEVKAEIPAYSCRRNWDGYGHVKVPAIPAGSLIDWGQIRDRYNSSSPQSQKNAVASLMLYCGAAINMDYANGSNGGSAAYNKDVPVGLVKYFGYNPRTHYEMRNSYLIDDWYEMIYNQLKDNGPVFYTGQTSGNSGHAFVADGYSSEDNLFHINWGWGGYCDGYFVLAFCNPNGGGIGAGNIADGYRLLQSALVDAHPSSPADKIVPVSATISSRINGTSMEFTYGNDYGLTYRFDCGFGYVGKDGAITPSTLVRDIELRPSYYISQSKTIEIPSGSDEVRIVPLSKASDADQWVNPWPESRYILARRNSDNTISVVEMPQTGIEASSMEFGNVRRVGLPLMMRAELSSSGGGAYEGIVYVLSSENQYSYNVENTIEVVIENGKPMQIENTFTPSASGRLTYILSTTQDNRGRLASVEVEILDAENENPEQPLEITDINVAGADKWNMYEDDDREGVVIPVDVMYITGSCTLRLNESFPSRTMVISYLYKYNEDEMVYEEYKRNGSYILFSGNKGSTINPQFSFTGLGDGKYKLEVLAGPENRYGDVPDPIARLGEYRFAVGNYQSGITLPEESVAQTGDNIIYGIDGRTVRICGSAEEVSDALRSLAPGLYIVNGRKVAVR